MPQPVERSRTIASFQLESLSSLFVTPLQYHQCALARRCGASDSPRDSGSKEEWASMSQVGGSEHASNDRWMERSLSSGSVDDSMWDLAASRASSRNSSASAPADSLDLRSRKGILGSSAPILPSIESRVRDASSRSPESRASAVSYTHLTLPTKRIV